MSLEGVPVKRVPLTWRHWSRMGFLTLFCNQDWKLETPLHSIHGPLLLRVDNQVQFPTVQLQGPLLGTPSFCFFQDLFQRPTSHHSDVLVKVQVSCPFLSLPYTYQRY